MKPDRVYNRIKAYRQKAGTTQEEVASAIGVSRQTVIAIERGNYVPSVLLGLRLAGLFKVSVEELFSLEKNNLSQ